LLGIVVVLYLGVALAVHTPPALRGPDISLDPHVLPYYAGLSIVRMAAAYLLSLLFALWYGRAAAHNPRVERVLMPLLDVLQSVPILSFLPVRNYPESLSSNCLLHKGREPFSFFRRRHVELCFVLAPAFCSLSQEGM